MVLIETSDYSDRILKYNCNFSGQGRPHGGVTGVFCPLPQPERGPLNTCLKKDRYTLIEQSGSRPFLATGPLFNSFPWAL